MQDDESREQNRRIRKLFALIRVIRGQKLLYKNCTISGTPSYKKCKNRGTPCRSPARQQGGTFNLYVTPSLTIRPPQESVLQILAKPWNKPQNHLVSCQCPEGYFRVYSRNSRAKAFLQELHKRWNIVAKARASARAVHSTCSLRPPLRSGPPQKRCPT
jgi:hypothetical protein